MFSYVNTRAVMFVQQDLSSHCERYSSDVWQGGSMQELQELNQALLTLTVLVATIDAQWEGMGDVGSARYEPALLPPCPTIKVLCYSN